MGRGAGELTYMLAQEFNIELHAAITALFHERFAIHQFLVFERHRCGEVVAAEERGKQKFNVSLDPRKTRI
jgi:hypothetical protein